MDSTSTLSPPISCARAARSVVAVMTCNLLAAFAGEKQTHRNTAKAVNEAAKRVWILLSLICISQVLRTDERRERPSRIGTETEIHWHCRSASWSFRINDRTGIGRGFD